jgi:hypothetical protein
LSKEFEVKIEFLDSSYLFQLREQNSTPSKNLLLHITLRIPLDRRSYTLECYEVKNGSENNEELSRLHSIKVEGLWNLKTLEGDLLTIVRREFKTFKPRFYPF